MQYSTQSSQALIPSIYTSTALNFTQRASQTIQSSSYKCAISSHMGFDNSFDPSLQDSIHSMQTSLILPQTLNIPCYASTKSLYEPVPDPINLEKRESAQFNVPSNFLLQSSIPLTQTLRRPSPTLTALPKAQSSRIQSIIALTCQMLNLTIIFIYRLKKRLHRCSTQPHRRRL